MLLPKNRSSVVATWLQNFFLHPSTYYKCRRLMGCAQSEESRPPSNFPCYKLIGALTNLYTRFSEVPSSSSFSLSEFSPLKTGFDRIHSCRTIMVLLCSIKPPAKNKKHAQFRMLRSMGAFAWKGGSTAAQPRRVDVGFCYLILGQI